jgi:ubiquitin-activating enzyme E1
LFDSLECLPDEPLSEAEVQPIGSRYDGQIAVLGRTLHKAVENSRYFLIGAGAIGCEMLKNWAMMGLGSGPEGSIHVTDMDAIEISNLNRQFLYREWDVKKMKSEVAGAAVKKMNPHLKIKAMTLKVGPETEDVYDDEFWTNLTGICNALDNVNARLYTDGRAVFYRKTLLESGTLGPKGNTQVIVPFMTESYGSSVDPPEKNPPTCLVHTFPHNIEHCLQWARELVFEGKFVADPDIVNKYLDKPGYLETIAPNLKRTTLETLRDMLLNRQKNFDECIVWARNLFEKVFVSDIKQLLYQFPPEFKDPKTGSPFWSGAKKPPAIISFDPNDPLHLGFVTATAYLRAWNLGITQDEFKPKDFAAQVEHIKKVAGSIQVQEWKPKGIVRIVTDEKEENKDQPPAPSTDDDERIVKEILDVLPGPEYFGKYRMNVLDFEKDDDRNFHIDLIHSGANIRAAQYKIKTVERLQAKLIAGKIIPAIVTTTASVTGLVCLEYYKLLQNKKIEAYRNTFMNLAIPVFQQGEPVPPKKTKFGETDVTLWTRIDVKIGDATLQQVLDYLQKEYKLEIDVLGIGAALLYSSWMPAAKKKERLARKVTEILEEVTKQQLKPKQRHFNIEVTGTLNEADVDIPTVTMWFK